MTVEINTADKATAFGAVRVRLELFLISLVILFLELACIRWFPAHVLYLTFFTNTVLLACFLGMSVGCLVAGQSRNYLAWTPFLLAAATGAGLFIEGQRYLSYKLLDVGNQASPQLVFFGTDYYIQDLATYYVPIEALNAFFFVVIALALVGPGQELGRALDRLPDRVQAYSVNILGSIAGILLFGTCSWLQLEPVWWFLLVALGLAYFLWLTPKRKSLLLGWIQPALFLLILLWAASVRTGTRVDEDQTIRTYYWSPYYRIDYLVRPSGGRFIWVNLIGHQDMKKQDDSAPGYDLPHLLNRIADGKPFENVLVIGAGSGNDVSRALHWGAQHVDAVEIDPVIQRLGQQDHPEHPYQDKRVSVHINDGRNFLHSTQQKYDVIIYALVDSLVLHSSYSNIRLESYLFTDQAFADVRRCLKPDGVFVMYNYFRHGWIVARLHKGLNQTFETAPLVLTMPYQQVVEPAARSEGFTLFFAGSASRLQPLRDLFPEQSTRWLSNPGTRPVMHEEPVPEGIQLGWSSVTEVQDLRAASDDWPFLYLRRPMIPLRPSLSGMALMGVLSLALILIFFPRHQREGRRRSFSGQMFFLGAGFMLVETKAVVHLALIFGSTWVVNSVVFFAVLMMILIANLFVLAARPNKLWPYYLGLSVMLAVNCLVPLNVFLGMEWPLQIAVSCLLVFTPILFAAVIFAVAFGRSKTPDRDFGANIAGALLGGLAENASMLLGFQYLLLVALAFYSLSALFYRRQSAADIDRVSAEIA